jgi:hypothetical protein
LYRPTGDSNASLTAKFETLAQINPSVINSNYFLFTNVGSELASLQLIDVRWKPVWQKSAEGQNDFFVRDGLLYRRKHGNVIYDRM